MRRVLVAIVLAAAGAARAQERPLTPAQAEGRELYNATCVYCHGPRGYGTEALALRLGPEKAELARRDDLPDRYIRLVVKRGLGNMPAYTPTDLTPAQLTAIVDYLRRNSAAGSAAPMPRPLCNLDRPAASTPPSVPRGLDCGRLGSRGRAAG